MICLKLNWFFYGLSRMLQFSQFAWTPCYSVWDVFNHFLLIDATDRSNISGDQKRFFIALSLYPLSFFANTPFKPTIFKHCVYFGLSSALSSWRNPGGGGIIYMFNFLISVCKIFIKSTQLKRNMKPLLAKVNCTNYCNFLCFESLLLLLKRFRKKQKGFEFLSLLFSCLPVKAKDRGATRSENLSSNVA